MSTVPLELFGCWRREWIELADGSRDTDTVVYWLQLESRMVDVRIPFSQPRTTVAGFDQFSLDELMLLADSESSSGYTTCTPVVVGDDGIRRATAEWITRGQAIDRPGVAFQPVTAFPEPGLLEWSDDGTTMIERAPSGKYFELWQLVPGTGHALEHRRIDERTEWYRTGDVAVVVRDRSVSIPRLARLQGLIADCDGDRSAIAALLDCEFSVGHFGELGWTVISSTLPWRVGEALL